MKPLIEEGSWDGSHNGVVGSDTLLFKVSSARMAQDIFFNAGYPKDMFSGQGSGEINM